MFISCQEEVASNEPSITSSLSNLFLASSSPKLSVSFTIENTTSFEPLFEVDGEIEKLTETIFGTKQAVNFEFSESNNVEATIEVLESSVPSPMISNGLPSSLASVKQIRYANGTMKLFDSEGAMISEGEQEFPYDLTLFSDLQESVEVGAVELNTIVRGIVTDSDILSTEQWVELEAMPNADLAIDPGGFSSVSLLLEEVSDVDVIRFDFIYRNIEGVRIVDAIGAYNSANELVHSTMFKYGIMEGGQLPIESIFQKQVQTLPSGKKILMKVLSEIENFEFSIN